MGGLSSRLMFDFFEQYSTENILVVNIFHITFWQYIENILIANSFRTTFWLPQNFFWLSVVSIKHFGCHWKDFGCQKFSKNIMDTKHISRVQNHSEKIKMEKSQEIN